MKSYYIDNIRVLMTVLESEDLVEDEIKELRFLYNKLYILACDVHDRNIIQK